MIDSFILKSGSALFDKLTIYTPPGITIFVGPNNSGKTSLLRAIHASLTGGPDDHLDYPSALESVVISAFVEEMLDEHPDRDSLIKTHESKDTGTTYRKESYAKTVSTSWLKGEGYKFRNGLCIWMNGSTRLSLLPTENRIDLRKPKGPLHRLLLNDEKRSDFQEAVFSGIGYYPAVDTTSSYGEYTLKFSATPPGNTLERSLDEPTIQFFEQATPAGKLSDGYRAFTGILGALYATNYKAIFIDEPEAFLHPTLSRTLGRKVSQTASGKCLLAATHSVDFLMGAIESGVKATIVRLQRNNSTAAASLLDSQDLIELMNDPLLRSNNVLSGLFAQSVVVCEADADRAFYQEINTRLLLAGDKRGIENALFLNAQGKHTIPKIVRMLRKMGVPTIGIYDLDVLKEGGKVWTRTASACGIPSIRMETLAHERKVILEHLRSASTDDQKTNFKTNGGIKLLRRAEYEIAHSFLNFLESYGMFIVPNGEVEAWLPDLNVSRTKEKWLREIFEKMGNDPNNENYVTPQKDDVWDFIGRCNNWLASEHHLGMEHF